MAMEHSKKVPGSQSKMDLRKAAQNYTESRCAKREADMELRRASQSLIDAIFNAGRTDLLQLNHRAIQREGMGRKTRV